MDREIFWYNLFKVEGLMSSKLILGGDLNFSVGFLRYGELRLELIIY